MKKTVFFLALSALVLVGCGKTQPKQEVAAADSVAISDTTQTVLQEIDSVTQVADEKLIAL